MRRLLAGLGMLGLIAACGCSYTVEMPEEEPPADAGVSSPSVTATPALPVMEPAEGTAGPQTDTGRVIAVGSALKLTAPDGWVPKPPAIHMIQNEFAVPAAADDENDGRVTVMTVGGSVEANIGRWIGQFAQPDGSNTEEKAWVEKLDVAGCEVHLVDISGTYSDSRGMMAPAVQRPDYRMLAAIIVTAEGNYFVKFYGPARTVEREAGAFRAMVESLGQ